ncbi:nucleoside hydrolase [Actinomyces gaoshouyii]|uniref:Ribosylpyrimidine nucleosidase n=1 Tax=Actinomyces gaoshouyii TaxID=1960083 RepID=A0A8H9H7V4_9ACTO|nr:nucleoside hydrolase [Actinomyces gaoshouyii]ARD42640.1 ribonucleoside hydrolase [Actinomyces gaoshouyii]GGO94754.1 ribosylpyrimidine nucleosidase [Actinomyces gaoshouyii]
MATTMILDCDPGHDDAIAILLALGSPEVDLIGITTIGGNHGLDKVTHNARAVCELAGRPETPIHAGCRRPLIRRPIDAAYIHGETGLDGVDLPEPSRPLAAQHAVDWLIETIMGREPGTITIVPTGPLTNIAMAARLEPRIVARVKEIVLMGGAYGVGNATPVAEFNILCDPEAAQIVFNESWPVTMIGLDVTHRALCTPEVQADLCEANPRLADAVGGLMDFFRSTYRDQEAFPDPPTHDPCAVARVIDPSLIPTRRCPIDVELRGTLTYGMTVTDMRALVDDSDPACTTRVGTGLDAERFWELVADALARLG